MSTSGSYDFTLTASAIITEVGENLGIIEAGGTLNTADINTLLRRLNIVAKEHSSPSDGLPGLQVFNRKVVHLFLNDGQNVYTIGPSGATSTLLYGRTTTTVAASAGANSLSITANSDSTTFPETTVTMTPGDYMRVQNSDQTVSTLGIQSSTSTTVAITSTFGKDIDAGAYVWWYTDLAQRLTTVESAYIRTADLKDSPLDIYIERKDYDHGVSDKYMVGTPSCLLVEPLLTSTRITLDRMPDDLTRTIVITGLYPAEDYDSTSNDLAFPQEWGDFLAWKVTRRACVKYGVKWTADMEMNYQESKMIAGAYNPEQTLEHFQCGVAG